MLTALYFAVILFLAGCGYTNPYAKSTDLDEDQDGTVSIYVEMWKNQTSELGFQAYIKQSLIRWLKKSRRFSIARKRSQADYVLDGIINSAHYPGLSYGTFDRAVELRAEIEFSFDLKKNGSGETVLQKRNFVRRESFRVGDDAAATETNKRQALFSLADDIADNIYVQLFYKFSRNDMLDVREELFLEDETDEFDD